MVIDRLRATPPLNSRRRSYLRLAEQTDAPLIHSLRSDPKLNRFLNAPPASVHDQAAWLKRYKDDEAAGLQYYFIIMSGMQERGTVRMYDFRTVEGLRSFCWGSWIIAPPPVIGLASYTALAIYELGFEHLNFEHAHFDVRRANQNVVSFHLRSGAKIVDEDEQDFFFHFSRDAYVQFKAAQAHTLTRHSAEIPEAEEVAAVDS
ncbi:GNAT family N-acetyltransferase [Methylobacterium sp. E-046]|uniref:GNAT family N-acetyltransferase n=1 Tax=Methylobacterium sp. E-046 TaxID=2836576 RepID=UPI001FBBAA63|nr:GNAT family N-acetyltransferase [Methylobacterium sp. E-046]MCJ2099398.1 GNAT family N-acetyltransferase [Methylobacterium sp. E-046]